jgi:hypothetical protein
MLHVDFSRDTADGFCTGRFVETRIQRVSPPSTNTPYVSTPNGTSRCRVRQSFRWTEREK